jgi:hypothetical protein
MMIIRDECLKCSNLWLIWGEPVCCIVDALGIEPEENCQYFSTKDR